MHYYLDLDYNGLIDAKQQSPKIIIAEHLNPVSEEIYEKAEIGGKYLDGKLYPPPPVPDPDLRQTGLTRMNFMLRLDDCGYLDAVEQDVADGKLSKRAKIMWENAEVFERLSPELDKWAADLGFTDEQLDEVFEIKST